MRSEYEREFRKLMTQFGTMDASLSSQVRILLSRLGGKWAKRFASAAGDLADRFTNSVSGFSKKNLESSLDELTGVAIKPPTVTGELEERLKAATAYNVSLIKSIPEQFHDKIQGSVMRSLSGGEGLKGIYDDIVKTGTVTHKRAKFIAEDQTRKLTTAFHTERLKSVGIQKVRWAEPREVHLRVEGQVFDLDDPPIIDERTGQRGWGGEVPNCKCTVVPVIEFD